MKINLQSVFKLLLTALLLSLVFLFSSCGARKAEKARAKEETQTETSAAAVTAKTEESNVKKTENTIIDDKNETITEETVLEPMDPSKPASITEANGDKIDLTNSKKTWKRIRQKNNTKTDNTKSSDENKKSKTQAKSESKKKKSAKKAAEEIKVDRAAWSVWNLLWLLIPIGIYLAYKKYSDKIWWM